MAKETFQRTKPHVNVGSIGSSAQITKLQQQGISPLGARQLLSGQIVTSSQDRKAIAAVVCSLLSG